MFLKCNYMKLPFNLQIIVRGSALLCVSEASVCVLGMNDIQTRPTTTKVTPTNTIFHFASVDAAVARWTIRCGTLIYAMRCGLRTANDDYVELLERIVSQTRCSQFFEQTIACNMSVSLVLRWFGFDERQDVRQNEHVWMQSYQLFWILSDANRARRGDPSVSQIR